ncbi:MAG TPA: ABC transporter substrate-binding protein [Bryobacteraceae bacterium]
MRPRLGYAILALTIPLVPRAAERPHYGGTLRVEIRASIETPDPPQTGIAIPDLASAFSVTRWEGGRLAAFAANEDAPGGRPYLDSIGIQMARPHREQAIDLELGRADIVELGVGQTLSPANRTSPSARRIWTSEPVRLLALAFSPQVTDPRLREAVALAVDRAAIHNVLFQRAGEIAGSLLPQWISGYAFLFPTTADPQKARTLAGGLPPPLRTLSLSFTDPEWRAVAERIAVNARDAGISISTGQAIAKADLRLVEVRIPSSDPGQALAALAAAFAFPEPPNAATTEMLLAAERSYLANFKVIPLFHLPYIYGVGPRVRGGPGITPLGEWRFENLWLEPERP